MATTMLGNNAAGGRGGYEAKAPVVSIGGNARYACAAKAEWLRKTKSMAARRNHKSWPGANQHHAGAAAEAAAENNQCRNREI